MTTRLNDLWSASSAGVLEADHARPLYHATERALRNVCASPFTAAVTVVLSSGVLLVVGIFLLLSQNMDNWLTQTEGQLKMTAFFRSGIDSGRVKELIATFKADERIEKMEFIDKDEALGEFSQRLGKGNDLLAGLEFENPLPDSLEITLKKGKATTEQFRSIADLLSTKEEIETVDYDAGLLGQFLTTAQKMRALGRGGMVILLGLAAVLIATSFRLSLYAHRDEIAIMRLVGGTDADIRLPYLLEGGLLGASAGLIALIGTLVCAWFVRGQLQSDAMLKLVFSGVDPLSWWRSALLPLIGSLLGVLGSFLAVRRFVEMAESEELE